MTNLRDKLVISICDNEDHSVTQTGGLSFTFFVVTLSHTIIDDFELAWIDLDLETYILLHILSFLV